MKVRTTKLGDDMAEIFSVAAFIITLRETIEAALIIGILLAYLTKTQNEGLKREVWKGTGIAIALSILGAILFEILLEGFEGTAETIFEGSVMILAAGVLTWMIIWMFHNAKYLKLELEAKVQATISGTNPYGLMLLSFVAVFREGVETVLFLAGIRSSADRFAVLTGSVVGIGIAIILAVQLMQGTVKLNLRQFFNVTSIILILFAAGLFSQGVHEFQELGVFGASTVAWNKPILDLSGILNDKTNVVGSLLRSLFGYQDKPTLLEIGAYLLYWIGIGLTYLKISKISRTYAINKVAQI